MNTCIKQALTPHNYTAINPILHSCKNIYINKHIIFRMPCYMLIWKLKVAYFYESTETACLVLWKT